MWTLLLAACGPWSGTVEGTAAIGDPAADFTLPDDRGGEITLSDLAGEVILLDFSGFL